MQHFALEKHYCGHYKEISHNEVWVVITLQGNTLIELNSNSHLDNRTTAVHDQTQAGLIDHLASVLEEFYSVWGLKQPGT